MVDVFRPPGPRSPLRSKILYSSSEQFTEPEHEHGALRYQQLRAHSTRYKFISTTLCGMKSSSFKLILLLFSFYTLSSTIAVDQSFSNSGPRSRFEERFNTTCGKYPFVQKFVSNLESPSERYIIFAFHEAGSSNGGLGDRLGGLVTAVAYALRTGRTLLISGDKAFNEAFQPYHPNNNGRYHWRDWQWAGWRDEYNHGGNYTYLRNCVNPRPSAKICALDKDLAHRVVKFRSNRAFLCRWVVKQEIYDKSLLADLGISSETDLFEAAGCMLRLAMWPTERLWKALDKSLETQFISRSSSIISYQLGFHFRCGDSSFKPGQNSAIPGCFFESKEKWNGTAFMDDKSLDSPVDHADCGRKIINDMSVEQRKNAMVYIASDNHVSGQQINSTLNWPFVILPPEVCHVDLQASFECTLSTSLHWFMLSLSDKLVMQGLIKPVRGSGSSYEDVPPRDGEPLLAQEQGSISAFSRFAGIYGLNKDISRYGLGCQPINKTALSKQTQGNWLCNPKQIY